MLAIKLQRIGKKHQPSYRVVVAADGAGSFLTIRHADINRGAVKFRNGATGLLEDSYVHEFKNGSVPIAGCTPASGSLHNGNPYAKAPIIRACPASSKR